MKEPVTIAFVGHAAAAQAAAASAYEDEVLPLLAHHGAQLLHRGRRAQGQDPSLPVEAHLIRFPSRAAYDGYLVDERRLALIERHGEVFSSKVVVELDLGTTVSNEGPRRLGHPPASRHARPDAS